MKKTFRDKCYPIRPSVFILFLVASCANADEPTPVTSGGYVVDKQYTVNFSANIINDTCEVIINNSMVELGTVGLGYFGDHNHLGPYDPGTGSYTPGDMKSPFTPEIYQGGGKEFTVTLKDCRSKYRPDASELHLTVSPLAGYKLQGSSKQIFPNMLSEGIGGAVGVGVVVFYALNNGETINVLDSGGNPRDFAYDITGRDPEKDIYTFYTRFQQIDSREVYPGGVRTQVLIEAYYD